MVGGDGVTPNSSWWEGMVLHLTHRGGRGWCYTQLIVVGGDGVTPNSSWWEGMVLHPTHCGGRGWCYTQLIVVGGDGVTPVHNNKSVQLPYGINCHHLGSMMYINWW